MKVLFITYPRIGLGKGGLEIQIEKTAEALRLNGVQVILYDPWRNQIPEVDICHVFSTDGTLVYHAERAAGIGKPVVMSPVFNCFTVPFWQTALKVKLSRHAPGVYTDLRRAARMLGIAGRVIALNEDERRLLMRAFGLPPEKCVVVPNGINTSFASGNPALFEERFGVRDFVLQVASIEPRKNQLNLIKAMKEVPCPLVLIGQATPANEDYLQQCRREAEKDVIFTGHLSNNDPLLASAFASARVFALPSYSEVMPLTIYEAAVAGCRLVVSKHVPVAQCMVDLVPQVDPDAPSEIASAIRRELESPDDDSLCRAVAKMATWSDVARQIKSIYLELAPGKGAGEESDLRSVSA